MLFCLKLHLLVYKIVVPNSHQQKGEFLKHTILKAKLQFYQMLNYIFENYVFKSHV